MTTATILNKMRQKTKQYIDKATKFRLPDGARFEAVYDGGKEKWAVTLIIGEQSYTTVGSGIHWSLRKLGKQFDQHNKK